MAVEIDTYAIEHQGGYWAGFKYFSRVRYVQGCKEPVYVADKSKAKQSTNRETLLHAQMYYHIEGNIVKL